jgi:purine catabolism regulator
MLTTGFGLRGHAQAQRTLIAELEETHIAALGFGVGLAFKRIPSALRAEAERRSYPVFEIPLATPFREIVTFVNQALLGGETRLYQRLSSMQRYLVDALGAGDPQQTVLERLAQLLDAAVVVFHGDGSVEQVVGKPPTGQLWSGILQRADALIVEFDVDDWQAVATQIPRSTGSCLRWLAVASPGSDFSGRFAKAAAQVTAPLLAAIARLGERANEQDRAIRSALLDEMLASRDGGRNARAFTARAAALGIDFASPAHVVVVAHRAGEAQAGSGQFAAAAGAIQREFAEAEIPNLMTGRGSQVVALARDNGEALRLRLVRLAAEQPELVVGIGRRVSDVGAVGDSFRDAVLAIDQRFNDGGVVGFADLDLGTLLVSEVDEERVRPKIDEYLAPLRDHPELYQTLRAYFRRDLDVVATAQTLHIHPNTLRYRLSRIEELIGRSLRQPATIAALHIVLAAAACEPS